MSHEENLIACAQIVEKGDADRFAAVMAVPVEFREYLWPLYAFNVEVARAPWVTEEAGIAEIRLQWWRDALSEIAAGKTPRRHPVVEPLAQAIWDMELDIADLDGLVDARRWDIYREPFADLGEQRRYLDATSGALMEAACVACCFVEEGLSDAQRSAARKVGFAQGVANWFMAVPDLEARGRKPMVDGTHDGVRALAEKALEALTETRSVAFGDEDQALLAAWRAKGVLREAVRDPAAVAEGRLGGSEFQRRVGLAWQSFTGRR